MTTLINWSPGFCCQPRYSPFSTQQPKGPCKNLTQIMPLLSPTLLSLPPHSETKLQSSQLPRRPARFWAPLPRWAQSLPLPAPSSSATLTSALFFEYTRHDPSSGLVVPSAWKVLLQGNYVVPALTTFRSSGKCPLGSLPYTLHLKLHPTPYRLCSLPCFIKW